MNLEDTQMKLKRTSQLLALVLAVGAVADGGA
jgi:hypothetical protein